eukprot:m.80599 g.80599  ORF g.80599 m.80599 type:complete len:596 (+) comp14552_c0_seq1:35-1822(+)
MKNLPHQRWWRLTRAYSAGSVGLAAIFGYNVMTDDGSFPLVKPVLAVEDDSFSTNPSPMLGYLSAGTAVVDPSTLEALATSMMAARVVYRPAFLNDKDHVWTPAVKDAKPYRYRVLEVHEAAGTTFRNEEGLICHHCSETFAIAALKVGTLLERLQRLPSSRLRRYHCTQCYRSVCGSCSSTSTQVRVCQPCQQSPPVAKAEIQYAVLRVHEQGRLVITFRGTKTRADMAIDAKTKPKPLLRPHDDDGGDGPVSNGPSSQASSPRSRIHLHGGVVDQVALAYPALKAAILAAYREPSNQRLQLTMTGHSLGGSYAVAFALRALADDELRPLLLKQQFQVLTFGSPRIVYQPTAACDTAAAVSTLSGAAPPTAAPVVSPTSSMVDERALASTHAPLSDDVCPSAPPPRPPRPSGLVNTPPVSSQDCSSAPTIDEAPWHSLASGDCHPEVFFQSHFFNVVNDQDLVPRLLGNRITGSSLALTAIHTLAKPLLSLHIAAAEVETQLQHFTHLGAVMVLDDNGGLIRLPTDSRVSDGFFSTRPAWQQILRNHRTGEYELRVQRALVGRIAPGLESLEETETEAEEDVVMAQLLAQAEFC